MIDRLFIRLSQSVVTYKILKTAKLPALYEGLYDSVILNIRLDFMKLWTLVSTLKVYIGNFDNFENGTKQLILIIKTVQTYIMNLKHYKCNHGVF